MMSTYRNPHATDFMGFNFLISGVLYAIKDKNVAGCICLKTVNSVILVYVPDGSCYKVGDVLCSSFTPTLQYSRIPKDSYVTLIQE